MSVREILFIVSIGLSLISLALTFWARHDSIKEQKQREEEKKNRN